MIDVDLRRGHLRSSEVIAAADSRTLPLPQTLQGKLLPLPGCARLNRETCQQDLHHATFVGDKVMEQVTGAQRCGVPLLRKALGGNDR